MGTSFSTPSNQNTTSAQRPTRYPLPVSLLDFDPRQQTPPWVPRGRPDPHARFLEGYRGDAEDGEDGKGEDGAVDGAVDGKIKTKTKRKKQKQSGKRETNGKGNKKEKEEKLIDIDEENEEKANSSNSDSNSDTDDSDHKKAGEQRRNEPMSQEMWYRERYFERRRWAEERDQLVREGRIPLEQTGIAAGGTRYHAMLVEEQELARGGVRRRR